MRAGRLNRYVTIRTASTARDGAGAVVPTYSNLATNVPAQRTDTGGQESWRGRQIAADLAAVFVMRHRTDVTPQMQVLDGSEVFEIVAVQNGRQEGGGWQSLELMCRKLGA